MATIAFDLWQAAAPPWRPDPADWTAGWRQKLLAADGAPWPASHTVNATDPFNARRFDQLDFGGLGLSGAPALEIAAIEDPVGSEVMLVTSRLAWNAIKCISVTAFDGTALVLQNFVDAMVDLGGATQGLDLTLDGSKRGRITTGTGDDSVRILADSNGRLGGNGFVIDTGAGDDLVSIGASTTDWSTGVSAARYRAEWTDTDVDLGAGDDWFEGGGSNDRVRGGDGDDTAAPGGGRNLFDGGAGDDTVILDGSRADWSASALADGYRLRPLGGDPRDGTVIRDVERIVFAAGGAPVDLDLAYLGGPMLRDDRITAAVGQPEVMLQSVLLNDAGNGLVITGFTGALSGTIVQDGLGGWKYRPAAPGAVVETLAYTVADITGATATATLTLEVRPPAPPRGLAVQGIDGVPFAIADQDGDGVAELAFVADATAHVVFTAQADGLATAAEILAGIDGYAITGTNGLAVALNGGLALGLAGNGPSIAAVSFARPAGPPVTGAELAAGIGGHAIARPAGQELREMVAAGDVTGDGLGDLVLLTGGAMTTAASLWLVPGQAGGEAAQPTLLAALPALAAVENIAVQLALDLAPDLAPDDDGDGLPGLLLTRASIGLQVIDVPPVDTIFLRWSGGEARLLAFSVTGLDTVASVPLGLPQDVAAADVSGDGVADLVIAGRFDPETLGEGPRVVLGSGGGYALDGDGRFGLAPVGDVNGDGVADLAQTVGDHPFPWGPRIVFGRPDPAVASLPPAGFVIGPDDFAFETARIIDVGDQNGDGLDDLLVGTPQLGGPGSAYLVFGKADPAPVLVADLLAGMGGVAFVGQGAAIAALPDLDGDGRQEF